MSIRFIKQQVEADAGNSSTTNLASGNSYTFTGASASTLGVVGLQWSLWTDQNATVYIEQSPDGTNWDISDEFNYYHAKGGAGSTVQALNSYWRIRVVLTGTDPTGHFRLQGVLCPIADPLPRSLSDKGNLQTVASIRGDENTSRHVWVNPTNELAVSPVYRLIGTAFDGIVLDNNFWTPTLANNGVITQSGGSVHINTSATASGQAAYVSVRSARFVAGSEMLFTAAINFETVGTAGNIRRIGAYDASNGYFFQLSGTAFSLGTRKGTGAASGDTAIAVGSFNGNLGDSWVPVAGTHYKLQIEYSPLGAYWYVNGLLLHAKTEDHLSDTSTLPITMENTNASIASVVELECDGAYIARQGELITNPTSKFTSGASGNGSVVHKRSAGTIRGIVISNITNNAEVDLYDGVSSGATLIWESGPVAAKTEGASNSIDLFELPFSTGLTLSIHEEDADVLVVYE